MSADRDLAEAIYREITQPERVNDALEVWRNPQSRSWTEFDRMAFVLCRISAAAIDRALFRRMAAATPSGVPWDGTVELTDPLTGDTKILDKRTGRIVETRRRGVAPP